MLNPLRLLRGKGSPDELLEMAAAAGIDVKLQPIAATLDAISSALRRKMTHPKAVKFEESYAVRL
jgi:hypothetical protein